MTPQAADIGLTRQNPNAVFSKIEDYFTHRGTGWSPTHAVLFVSETQVIEAVSPFVKISDFSKYQGEGMQWMVLRIQSLGDFQRGEAVGYAEGKYLGKIYDDAKLLLEALDADFQTTWWAKTFGIDRTPICSVLVAAAMKVAAFRFKDPKTGGLVPVQAVVPNGILAHAMEWPSDLSVIDGNIS